MTPDPPPSTLLSVKWAIPRVRAGVVRRIRLEQRLDDATKLALVVAPAGWGKTSLLSPWASAKASARRVAWVSLDESDDEPVRFWSYVLTALRDASDELSSAALEALPVSGEGPIARALPILLNELAASSAQHLLVLDDYHVINDREVHESLEFLLAHLPPALVVVISSRADPPLPLARMRVRGDLTEVRAHDLGFALDESAELISTVSEHEVDPETVAALWERTEGWAAGLQLAGLSLRGGVEPEVVRSDRHVFDYFEQEVLPSLTPPQRDLLLRTAPLELLSGSLCDTALGVEGSTAVLAELERADLFVVALDGEREWYRCHRLMRDALRRAPAAGSVAGERQVLRRAARWFEEHGRIDDAVRHLVDAGDHEQAERILTGQLFWFFERGWAGTFLALGERLPEGAVGVQLAVNLGYAADLCGRPDRVLHWLEVCENGLVDDVPLSTWRSGRAGVMALRAVMATPASETALAVSLCEEALALEASTGDALNPNALAGLARAYALDGRFEDGVGLLTELWRGRERAGWPTERGLQAAGLLALCLLALGRDDELDGVLAEAGELADVAERDWGPAGAPAAVAMLRLVQGRRAYQRGDVSAAAGRLSDALLLAEFAGRATYVVLGLVFLADLTLANGHRAEAQDTLVRAREVIDNDPVAPFVRTWLEEAETRVGRQAVKRATARGALFEELTDRELSILRMLPGTATQREIGAALFLSINTVKAYNKSLYRKLAVGSRAEAVQTARDLGLI